MFTIQHQQEGSYARTGRLVTAHGAVVTPAFVVVATRATVKAVEPQALVDIGVQIVISNSYHLHLRPGEETVASLGGLHGFSGWQGPTMTDSGGFQVFSLGAGKEHGVGKVASIFPGERPAANHYRQGKSLVTLTEEGVSFRSIIDGSEHFFSPESVIELQRKLGSDIALVLDECTSPLHDYAYTKAAMERTHRWAQRSLHAFDRFAECDPSSKMEQVLVRQCLTRQCLTRQCLFGIVQGGSYEDLRKHSARVIGEMGFAGFAIGGSLGRSKEEMHRVLDWTVPLLPEGKPKHLLGIGEIEDIFAGVRRGIDTFDCAAPTRIARNGTVFLRGAPRHRINLRNACFRNDPRPIDGTCNCFACKHHSRAYLSHLCRTGEFSFYRLATLHNLRFLVRLMEEIRIAIENDTFDKMESEWLALPKRDGTTE